MKIRKGTGDKAGRRINVFELGKYKKYSKKGLFMKRVDKNDAKFVMQSNNETLSKNIEINEKKIRGILKDCYDVVFRSISVDVNTKILLVFMNNLVDVAILDKIILKPWMYEGIPQGLKKLSNIKLFLNNKGCRRKYRNRD